MTLVFRSSVHPNIYVGKVQGSSMYLKWYYEVTVDHIEQVSNVSTHDPGVNFESRVLSKQRWKHS